MNTISTSSQREKKRTQNYLTTLLSVSLTTFLLGGILTYLVTNQFKPTVGTNAGDDSGKSAAKDKPSRPQARLVRVGTIERKSIVPVQTLVGDLIAAVFNKAF